MAEQILDGSDVHPAFEEVGGEGMAKRVTGGRFGEAGLARGFLELALHGGVMNVESGNPAGSWVGQSVAEGNRNCQGHSREALGYLRRSRKDASS